jgi:hypothetical protein
MGEDTLREKEKEIIKTVKSVLPDIEQITNQKESLKKIDIYQTPYFEEYFKKLPLEEKEKILYEIMKNISTHSKIEQYNNIFKKLHDIYFQEKLQHDIQKNIEDIIKWLKEKGYHFGN